MEFTFECPVCKKSFMVNHQNLAQGDLALKCSSCGSTPAPDIMTAYQNVGKTLTDLYGCGCGNQQDWLHKDVKK